MYSTVLRGNHYPSAIRICILVAFVIVKVIRERGVSKDMLMVFVVLSLASVVLSFGVCVNSIYNNKVQRSGYFNLLNLAILITLLGNYVEAASRTAEGSMVGVEVSYMGLPFIPVLWYLCILEFCGVISNRTRAMALLLVPLGIACLAFTWEHNHLLFRSARYMAENEFGQLRFDPGPLYFIKPLYLCVFIVLGIVTIIYKYVGGTPRFRQQAMYFLVSALIPMFTVSNYLVETDHSWFDITPYGLALSSFLFMLAHSRYGLSNYASAIKNSVIRELHEGIIIFDRDGIHLESNKMAKDIFPRLVNLPIGISIEAMDYLPFDFSTICGREGVVLEHVTDKNGLPRTYNLSVSCIRGGPRVLGYCAVAHNITPLKRVMGDLEKRAYLDPLTGIFNRGYFFEKANYHAAEGFLAQEPFSLIMFDLDHFKSVNDTYGHAGGDLVLRDVAAIAKCRLRKTDLLGRYGGEEFCILLPGTDLPEAVAKAEEIRCAIGGHTFTFEGKAIPVTSSFGVAVARYDTDGDTVECIVKRADAYLHEAKNRGRNRVASEETGGASRVYATIPTAKIGTKVIPIKE